MLKREIVAASFEAGASVSVVARRYDVNTNQLFIWRRLYRDRIAGGQTEPISTLLPVTIIGERSGKKDLPSGEASRIEIELPSGHRIRVGADIDGKVLRRVLAVLERR
jgi:transposase